MVRRDDQPLAINHHTGPKDAGNVVDICGDGFIQPRGKHPNIGRLKCSSRFAFGNSGNRYDRLLTPLDRRDGLPLQFGERLGRLGTQFDRCGQRQRA
jgi:hypothetical protein